jgi:hypothetical protein
VAVDRGCTRERKEGVKAWTQSLEGALAAAQHRWAGSVGFVLVRLLEHARRGSGWNFFNHTVHTYQSLFTLT